MSTYTIHNGDCLEVLRTMDDNSVDSICTDPPYGISFMAKKWDYDVPSIDVWKECLRVLKPGGHMLVACGTRTQHRMVVPIEDAGFEIRDVITWLYGSGFPKSLNISKAIDKEAGAVREVVGPALRPDGSFRANVGKSAGTSFASGSNDKMLTAPATDAAKQWEGFGTAIKPASEHFTLARKNGIELSIFKEVTEEMCKSISSALRAVQDLQSNSPAPIEGSSIAQWHAGLSINTLDDLSAATATLQSKLVGTSFSNIASLWKLILATSSELMSTFTTSTAINLITDLQILKSFLSLTTLENTHPHEQSGQQSSASFVEALLANVIVKLRVIASTDVQCAVLHDSVSLREKLSRNLDSEFWTLCRKPLSESTVAKNVLKWGTGGINVDGCRVETPDGKPAYNYKNGPGGNTFSVGNGIDGTRSEPVEASDLGRFPANLILDEEAAAALDEQSGVSAARFFKLIEKQESEEKDSASRFMYCAKASKSERNAGLEGHVAQKVNDGRDTPIDNPFQRGETERLNTHPTVKPVTLMAYLCKLITPPGGLVLDPFAGSGSTGVGALREGFKFAGIEREAEYVAIAQTRLATEVKEDLAALEDDLFGGAA